jgi:hypothetical protein
MTIRGCTERLLAIVHRPRWRAVLREIAQKLNEAEILYTVVGGTSAALHGVPIPVQDIDIETDAAGAYRFQVLFSGHARKPVALRESPIYRSHFGQFDFGIRVEVMGDLQRRQGESWVPSSVVEATTVDLGGIAVRTSSLEEETLAYIRRGRLERAARCLPYCDHGRLLALLRGEKTTQVI